MIMVVNKPKWPTNLRNYASPRAENARFCRWSRGYSWAFQDAWVRTAQAVEGKAGLRTDAPNPVS